MKQSKAIRELTRQLEEVGVTVESVALTGSGHYRYELTCRGNRTSLVVSRTTSDHRSAKNALGIAKRFVRESMDGCAKMS